MQKIGVANGKFLEDYGDILRHHVESILKSGMILDEDMNLVLTFWDPTLLPSMISTQQRFVLTSTTFATIGLITSLKLQSPFPVVLSLLPTTVQFISKAICCYHQRIFKKNFDTLIKVLTELYHTNKEISQYYAKRDLAVQDRKLQAEAYNLLLQPGLDFLKFATVELSHIVEKIKRSMAQLCELVPISESQFLCSLDSGLDNFTDLKMRFDKLSDLCLLITSNFLGCLGLSMCVQLWKEPCDFRKVLTELVPTLLSGLVKSHSEVKSSFNLIRFNLCNSGSGKMDRVVPNRFSKSLNEFLLHVQITFDKGRQLQLLLEDEYNVDEVVDILNDASKHIDVSKDCLRILMHRFEVLAGKNNVSNVGKVSLPKVEQLDLVEPCIPDFDVELKDEEYNLSIHGSDDCFDYIDELDDVSSNQDLSTLLLELKRKLQEKHVQDEVKVTVPPPPPQPPKLPVVNQPDINNLLKSVMLTAQNLKRSEEFQFGFNMFPEIPRPFNTKYRCFSVAMLPGNERQDVERGGKIIMPPSALEQLTRLNINYPMQFKIVNNNTSRTSHCGVLEFVADEGKVYLPLWMMQNLVLEEGDYILIESVSLPVGTFAKFQPLSPEFLDITNPKAVLENCLRTFSCLTSGDVIAVRYNQRVYELCVLETQPGNAISIIECDMNVEFAAPVGYKETEHVKPVEEGMAIDPTELMPEPTGFVAFRGQGNRLDGKRRKDSGSSETTPPRATYVRGIPDYDYQIGTLKFLRQATKLSTDDSKEENGAFKAFSGEGFSLKRRN